MVFLMLCIAWHTKKSHSLASDMSGRPSPAITAERSIIITIFTALQNAVKNTGRGHEDGLTPTGEK